MTKAYPTIQALLVAPAHHSDTNQVIISLGLVLHHYPILWNACHFYSPNDENYTSIRHIVAELIEPLWIKRPLSDYQAIIQEMAQLPREVSYFYLVKPEKREGLSRREIFSGQFKEEDPEAEWVEHKAIEPLPASLISGLSLLLLKGVTAVEGRLGIEILSQLSHKPIQKMNPRPTHLRLASFGSLLPTFSPTLLSMGYSAVVENEVEMLGKGGARFQSFARKLKDHLRRSTPKGRYLYLEMDGVYGRLFDNNIGKVLGACSGLEKAVKPCDVWFEDPILMENKSDHDQAMIDLLSFIRMRQMNAKIVAFEGINSTAAVQHIIEKKTAHAVRLAYENFPSLQSFLDTIMLCQAHNFTTIIGGQHSPPELLAWLGILFQPKLIFTAHPDQCAQTTNEMYRTTLTLNYQA